MSGRVGGFGRVGRGDAHLCAGCTDLLWYPVDVFVEAVDVVSTVA